MPIMFQSRIYREDLIQNRESRYVFGDNVLRRGLGGQAAQMRGEPNAIGIATKWAPNMTPTAFFTDARHEEQCRIIDTDIELVKQALDANRLVVFPADGIGTGFARLQEKAPSTHRYLCIRLHALGIGNAS